MSDIRYMRQCFQPRQWFHSEGEPDPFVVDEGDTFMWVYRRNQDAGTYEVGFFAPGGEWFVDAQYGTPEEAAARVNYLNGGK